MSFLLRMSGFAKAVMIITLALAMLPTQAALASPTSASDSTPLVVEGTEQNLIAYEAAAEAGEVEFEIIEATRSAVVAATAPRQVRVRKAFRITGVAQVYAGAHAKPRRVRLVEKNKKVIRKRTGKKWSRVAVKRTKRNGRFAFKIRKKHNRDTGPRVFRIRMPKAQGLRRGATRNIKIRVVAPPRAPRAVPAPRAPQPNRPKASPDSGTSNSGGRNSTPAPNQPANAPPAEPGALGSATDWSWLYPDGGRWNGCEEITWGYYPGRGYRGALNDFKEAFDRVSARTGLSFRYMGEVSERPRPQMPAVKDVNIVVGWSDARLISQLAGSVVGLASAVATTAPRGADVKWRLVRGWVALDADAVLRQGFATSGWPTWGQVMTHEIMHAIGLGHASARTQLMARTVTNANHNFGAGDLAGMHRVGASQACLL